MQHGTQPPSFCSHPDGLFTISMRERSVLRAPLRQPHEIASASDLPIGRDDLGSCLPRSTSANCLRAKTAGEGFARCASRATHVLSSKTSGGFQNDGARCGGRTTRASGIRSNTVWPPSDNRCRTPSARPQLLRACMMAADLASDAEPCSRSSPMPGAFVFPSIPPAAARQAKEIR